MPAAPDAAANQCVPKKSSKLRRQPMQRSATAAVHASPACSLARAGLIGDAPALAQVIGGRGDGVHYVAAREALGVRVEGARQRGHHACSSSTQ